MAAFELLLSQARRHCLTRDPTRIYRALTHSSSNHSFVWFPRSLSTSSSSSSPSESSSEPNPETRPNQPTRKPIPVETVAYPVKSAVPSELKEDPPQSAPPPPRGRQESDAVPQQPGNVERRTWSREDIRYVKDVPTIETVSYPVRVAPLPEDRVVGEGTPSSEESAKGEEKKDGHEQLEGERRRIEASNRMIRRVYKVEEERVPFPTLIPVEQKKKEKVIYDLKEAIRLVKVNT